MSTDTQPSTIMTNLPHISINRTTQPASTYLTFQITFPQSTPFHNVINNSDITSPTKATLSLDHPTLTTLITTAITSLYGFIGTVTIRYHIVNVNLITSSFTLGVDNTSSNSLRAALTYLTSFQNSPLSINLINQSITLDQTHLPKDWYCDLLE